MLSIISYVISSIQYLILIKNTITINCLNRVTYNLDKYSYLLPYLVVFYNQIKTHKIKTQCPLSLIFFYRWFNASENTLVIDVFKWMKTHFAVQIKLIGTRLCRTLLQPPMQRIASGAVGSWPISLIRFTTWWIRYRCFIYFQWSYYRRLIISLFLIIKSLRWQG